MHPPFTTTRCHQLDWLVPLSLHFWHSRSLSRKNWVPTRPAYSTDRGGFKSELLASFPSQLSSIVRVSTQVRVWMVAMLLPRRQDLLGAWGWKSQYTRPPDWYRAWSELPCRDTVAIFEFVLAAHKWGIEPRPLAQQSCALPLSYGPLHWRMLSGQFPPPFPSCTSPNHSPLLLSL